MNNNILPVMKAWWMGMLFVGIFFNGNVSTAQATVSIANQTSDILYFDPAADLDALYVAYEITNEDTATTSDLWVGLTDFSGPNVHVPAQVPSVVLVGQVAPGETVQVFLFIATDSTTDSSLNETFTAGVYSSEADSLSGNNPLATTPITITFQDDTIKASANKVNAVTITPNPPVFNQPFTVVVEGKTGTLGGTQLAYFSPSVLSSWPAGSIMLASTSLTFLYGTGTSDDVIYINELLITLPNSVSTEYQAEYTFKAIGETSGPTPVSPVGYINSGNTNMKHTDTGSFVALPMIQTIIDPSKLATTTASTTLDNLSAIDTDIYVETSTFGTLQVTGEPDGSVLMQAPVLQGSVLEVWFVVSGDSSEPECTDTTLARVDASGTYSAGDTAYATTTELVAGTQYYFNVCGIELVDDSDDVALDTNHLDKDTSAVTTVNPADMLPQSDEDIGVAVSHGGGSARKVSQAAQSILSSSDTPENKIQKLKSLIESLKQQLLNISSTLEEYKDSSTINQCPFFIQHMALGDEDGKLGNQKQERGVSGILNEVALLQTILTKQKVYHGPITGYFGILTDAAVRQWQTKHLTEVLDPWNLTAPTGKFYQSSERWMNELLGCTDTVVLDNGVSL